MPARVDWFSCSPCWRWVVFFRPKNNYEKTQEQSKLFVETTGAVDKAWVKNDAGWQRLSRAPSVMDKNSGGAKPKLGTGSNINSNNRQGEPGFLYLQGSYRSWKRGQVMEFWNENSRPGKVMEFQILSKVMERSWMEFQIKLKALKKRSFIFMTDEKAENRGGHQNGVQV